MYYSCKHCGRMHPVGVVCRERPTRKAKGDRETDRFRNTASWQRKREEIKLRDRYLCRVGLEERKIVYEGLGVHHIVSLEEAFERRLDDDNLITLCVTHHKMAERGEIDVARLTTLASIPPGCLGGKK